MRTIRHLLLVIIALLLLGTVYSEVVAQGPRPQPIPPLRPVFELAHPRVAVVNMFSGGAENFLHAPTVDPSEHTIRVPAGRTFRLTAPYETVVHSMTAGLATFQAEAYLIDGETRRLLAEDKATVANFGPRLHTGALNLDLKFDDPGTYHVLVRSVTQVKPVGANAVTRDEDEMRITIQADTSVTRLPGFQPLPVFDQHIEPEQFQPSPVQPIATRTVQVALPRGEIVATQNAAVNNFEQSARTTIVLNQGNALRVVAGPHEFVWFDGAAGSAETSLEVLDAVTDSDPPITYGSDSAEYRDVEGAARRRDTLEVDVTFEEPGTHVLIARLRSAVYPAPSTDAQDVVDEDDVYLHVVVVGTPEVGAIGGTVTAEDTLSPLAGVVVRAFAADSGRPVATVRTRDDGTYRFDRLKPGAYLIQATPDRQNYLAEWYDDQPNRSQADPVDVEAGQTADEVDFALTPGAVVAGLVTEDTDPTGQTAPQPLGGILIQVGMFNATSVANVIVGQTRTLNDGSYSIGRLPAGTYWVRAIDPEGFYQTEYWEDATTLVDAMPVELGPGQLMEDLNFALTVAGGGISGRVVRQGAATDPAVIMPIPGVVVTAWSANTQERVGKAETGPRGLYRMNGLPAGRYLIQAEEPEGRYGDEWYDDKQSPGEADPVVVEDGQITPDIDFALEPAAQIPTILRIDPPTTSVTQPGDLFDVALMIEQVEDLGSFEMTLTFDPNVVHVEGAELGAFLHNPDQTGRTYEMLEPIIDNRTGEARFGVFSVGTAPGFSGSGEVLRIGLVAQGAGDTVLHQQNIQVLDTSTEMIAARAKDGRVHVGGCMAYDFDCDCDVDIVDVSKVARRWGAQEGDPQYDPAFDLDDDGDIDIVDVAIIGAAWGTTCEDESAGARALLEGDSKPAANLPQGAEPLGTTVNVDAPAGASIGETVSVAVRISEAVDLKSFEFALAYNPTTLEFESVELGDFMEGALALDPIVDDEQGELRFGATELGAGAGKQGDGLLATVNFRAVGVGASSLTLADVKLVDSLNQEQTDVTTAGATLVIAGETQRLPLIRR